MLAYTMVMLVLLIGYVIYKLDGRTSRLERDLLAARRLAKAPIDLNYREKEEQPIVH